MSPQPCAIGSLIAEQKASTPVHTWTEDLWLQRSGGRFESAKRSPEILREPPREWFDQEDKTLPAFRNVEGGHRSPKVFERANAHRCNGQRLLGEFIEDSQCDRVTVCANNAPVGRRLRSLECRESDGHKARPAVPTLDTQAPFLCGIA